MLCIVVQLLSAQHLANCMFGLQGLSSAEVEGKRKKEKKSSHSSLLRCHITHFNIFFHWWLLWLSTINNSQYLIPIYEQFIPYNVNAVRALVHALVPKILACRDELSAKQISHALYGLQNLSSEHEEVRNLTCHRLMSYLIMWCHHFLW